MAPSNLIGQVLDGKYRINEQLGKGGMGAVYSAIHLGTERPVALKVIAPQLMKHDEFVERFRREARAAGRLQHPNVVQQLISLPITIFFSSLAAVVTALLYWKTRLAGGETMKQALLQFGADDVGIGRSQKRLRTRARTSMRTGR